MKPLLNKDFRRLRWLLKQPPSDRVRDYVIRELVTLAKPGGLDPRVLTPLRRAVYGASRMRMAHVISILCFVSRMRVEDRGPTNGIPLGIKMYWILYRFFSRAGVRSRALSVQNMTREAYVRYYMEEVKRWHPGRADVLHTVIEQKIVEGFPNLCTHVRARVERLYAFFELPPDLALPPPLPIRSIWEMPPTAEDPHPPYGATSHHQGAPWFR